MVSKGEVLENIQQFGLPATVIWFKNKHESSRKAETKTYKLHLEKIYSEYRNISKRKSKPGHQDRLSSYNNEPVKFPEPGLSKKRKSDEPDLAVKSSFVQKVQTLQEVSSSLGTELFNYKQENENLKERVHSLKLKLKVKTQAKLKIIRQEQVKRINEKKKIVNIYKRIIKKYKEEQKRLRSKVTYYEVKANNLKTENEVLQEKFNHENELKQNVELEREVQNVIIKDLQRDRNNLQTDNEWLESLLNDQLITFDEAKKSYTPQMQQCVYSLLKHCVATTKVPLVIESVLAMMNVKASKLPCKSTVNNMRIQTLNLVQKQLAEEFSKEKNTCVLSDETSKFSKKYEGFHAVDGSGRIWILGLRQMTTKSGQDALDTLLEILKDINTVSDESENETSRSILKNIASTMSDRASTQLKFNQLLEDYRLEILQQDLPWEDMSEDEQNSVGRLCNFFCSLHVLVHLAEAAEKSLSEIETVTFDGKVLIFDPTFKKGNESGTTRLIRTASKAFSRGGDEKNGAHGPFIAYCKEFLKDSGFHSLPLERFRGNRFNILFSNAAYVYFLSDKMKTYLEGGASNRLLKSVHYDLKVPEFLAGCRALGLISELITKPLWCLIENREVSILEMRQFYIEIVNYMENFKYGEFIEGTYRLSFVHDGRLNINPVFNKLIEPTEYDAKVESVLKVMVTALTIIMKRLFTDFLPGGKWSDVPHTMEETLKGTPKHNKFSETVFGQLDRLLREKPNVSIITAEAMIAFCHNKTLDWLMSKGNEERAMLCTNARQNMKRLRIDFKERQQIIENETRLKVHEKLAAAELANQKRIQKLENFTNEIQVWGLWQTVNEIDSGLSLLKTKKDKITALKAQLQFRKQVLKQTAIRNDVYNFSKKGVNLTIEELTENIKSLVVRAQTLQTDVRNLQNDNVIILGRKVEQAFIENGETVWYTGQVISQVPGYPDWFNIKYSGDPAIYSYRLMSEYEKGDLKLLL